MKQTYAQSCTWTLADSNADIVLDVKIEDDLHKLIMKAATGQTDPIQEWRNSSDTVISKINIDGSMTPASLAGASAVNSTIFYNSSTSKLSWKDSGGTVHSLQESGGATDLDGLSDVVITTAAEGNFLRRNSTEWVNTTISAGDVPNLPASKINSGTLNTARLGSGTADSTKYLAGDSSWQLLPFEMMVGEAEGTALTTGNGKVTFRMPRAVTLTSVRASLTAASTTTSIIVDIRKNGASILTTKLTIDGGELTSTTASAAFAFNASPMSVADDDEIKVDVVQAGSDATGLKVTLIGTRA